MRAAQTKMAALSPTPGWLKDEILLSADLLLLACKYECVVMVTIMM